MCVLGTKPGSPEGADSALNHEAIPPNPSFYSLMFIQISEVTASVLVSDLFILLISAPCIELFSKEKVKLQSTHSSLKTQQMLLLVL